ncbi:hypothetical protein AOQ84DRAFT_33569 [Glonium stellatum]|uniref:Uncharacterized protein n=1 Tax=Glonium stellatum TaxID=574774 RepID=A0A8E2F1F2_9PEZI|nr:hypothetical protein AOQ84DRAFT_33569 [Glonium stellatum]
MANNLSTNQIAELQHWSSFGQRGESSQRRVGASEWGTEPFQKPITSDWDISVPRTELDKLLNGFQPQAMEDKWFVYAGGPDAQGDAAVHMFRSWTGYKMIELKIKVSLDENGKLTGADSRITAITWESSEEKCGDQTEEGAKVMAREVCNWVMDVNLS